MTNQRWSRRSFLAASAGLAAAPTFFITRSARAHGRNALNLAAIGVWGRGRDNCNALAGAGANIVALCDVDANHLANAHKNFPDASTYRDFRVMLDRESSIDGVIVSTPDHTHAVAAAAALHKGLPVYCEKPLTRTVGEARALRTLAAETGVPTQMGTQIHAGDNYRRVVELIRSGAIGTVRSVHTWSSKHWSNGRFTEPKAAPDHLDWDLWLGPAASRPYCDGVHPANWRRFWAYGSGTLGDMGCHHVDLPFWALDLDAPTKIHAIGPAPHADGAPDSIIVEYQFPERNGRAPLTFTWYDGVHRPSALETLRHANGDRVQWGVGSLFIGDDGMLLADYGRHLLLPESKYADFRPPPKSIPNSVGHHREWLEACASGSQPTCRFDYAAALTETVLLGTVAYRVGRPIEWDAANLRSPNAPEADRYVNADYREGWTL